MKKLEIFYFLTILFILSGCDGCTKTKQESSAILFEEATIVDVIYTPSTHDTKLGLTMMKLGPVGIGFDGNTGIRMGGGLQVSSVNVPEKFDVIFKCQHGKFIVNGKERYDKFEKHIGKTVIVNYREIYKTTYQEKDGKDSIIERVLMSYDFIDATIK